MWHIQQFQTHSNIILLVTYPHDVSIPRLVEPWFKHQFDCIATARKLENWQHHRTTILETLLGIVFVVIVLKSTRNPYKPYSYIRFKL